MPGRERMGFNATWSMAVGGMVGGGIFSVLGVVVDMAGPWAWLSFVIAGAIALASAHSYAELAVKHQAAGGAYAYLRAAGYPGFAASLSWMLILGYVLTISVYAFTFGHYLAHALALGSWVPRICALSVVAGLTLVNLRGISESALLEIVTVWGKLAVLVGLAVLGMVHWAPEQLSADLEQHGLLAALAGAAVIFMAFEGFQLLAYDYDEIRNPRRLLPLASLSAVAAVILIYVLVAIGAAMLVGASAIVEEKEIALSIAGERAAGLFGLIAVTVAAAFSTASAINATLFSTARLMKQVADQDDLPPQLAHENRHQVPDHAVIGIGVVSAVLASFGSLGALVGAASLVFLFAFATVNVLAFSQATPRRWIALLGFVGCCAAGLVAIRHLLLHEPLALLGLVLLVLATTSGRPFLLRCARQARASR